MTYTTDKDSQCLGKFKYPTHSAAEMISSRRRETGLAIYKCPHCNYYHLGGVATKQQDYRRSPSKV
jgi:hypothetical protein